MIRKSLVAHTSHVWSEDPALDKTDGEVFKEKWEKFLEDGDVSKLPVKEGCQLSVFEIAPLSRKALQHVYATEGIDRLTEAVAYGLVSVTNFELDGRPVALAHIDSDRGKRLKTKSLDEIFDALLFAELGTRIVEISRIDPTRVKGS